MKQQKEVGKSIAYIDSDTMKALGCKKGEVIEITGERITAPFRVNSVTPRLIPRLARSE